MYFAQYNPRVEPEFVLVLTFTTTLEFVLIYPEIRFVNPKSVDQQGSDICGKQLSTFNDIVFNLLLISLVKVRIKEPASKSLNNIAVDCRQYKKPYNKKNRKLATSGGNGGIGKVKTPRAHRFVPPRGFSQARAWRSRGHLGTDSVRSKLPPLCVPVNRIFGHRFSPVQASPTMCASEPVACLT